MVDAEKRTLGFIAILMILLLSGWLVLDFLFRWNTGGMKIDPTLYSLLQTVVVKGRPHIHLIRWALILNLVALAYLQNHTLSSRSKKMALLQLVFAMIVTFVFIKGYSIYFYYNIIAYPVNFGLLFLIIPTAFRTLFTFQRHMANTLGTVTTAGREFTFYYPSFKGRLALHDARTATFIEGSAKAGKSASLVIPTIVQAVQKSFAGLIYDYEGDLREPGAGLLSRTAYTAVRQGKTNIKFAIINFTDLGRTVRCNPLAPKYILSYSHALEMATVIMYNINRSWSRHKDFWGENAIAAYAATLWFFKRNLPSYSTIPHTTEFLLNDFRKVLAILQSDEDVAPYIRPILAALERDASGQIAGAESSTQFPISKLRAPEIYYVLNPEPKQEFDLDITNKNHPTLLSVCNAPELQHALAPAIGAIIQVCKVQMNKLGKQRSVFIIDEMPTVYIDKADKIPAEARKKSVCTFFAVQTYDQLVRDYGVQNAKVIRNSCGNLFTGISSVESAELISKMMGEEKQPEYSATVSDSGRSRTQSFRNEKVLKASDIAAQDTGHFSGRILGGKPPFFSTQLKYKTYPAEEIPRFNYPVQLGNQELEEDILQHLVQENYQQVIKEVKNIVHRYEHLFENSTES